jgi:crotonobetainyl-CoA:carnitine CoA-transferase CaiB-like acyl-CoA transferase
VQHARIAAPLEHPRRGTIRVVDQVVKLERTPSQLVMPLEDKGGSNVEVLGELGLPAEQIADLRAQQVI